MILPLRAATEPGSRSPSRLLKKVSCECDSYQACRHTSVKTPERTHLHKHAHHRKVCATVNAFTTVEERRF